MHVKPDGAGLRVRDTLPHRLIPVYTGHTTEGPCLRRLPGLHLKRAISVPRDIWRRQMFPKYFGISTYENTCGFVATIGPTQLCPRKLTVCKPLDSGLVDVV